MYIFKFSRRKLEDFILCDQVLEGVTEQFELCIRIAVCVCSVTALLDEEQLDD